MRAVAKSRITVLHILPQNAIGGAELAACRAALDREEANAFFLVKSRATTCLEGKRITYGSDHFALGPKAVHAVLQAVDELDPEVVVFSLWRTFGAFLALRLLRPKRQFALFLHSERATHVVDRWVTRTMARLSHGVFADSMASLRRLGRREQLRTRVVSFMMHRLEPLGNLEPAPKFVYWGRLQALKNIPHAIDLFAALASHHPSAEFRLIGPDSGLRDSLEEQIARLGIGSKVCFEGPRSFEEIVEIAKEARFFLQLSHQEGMAMSVVEAMQIGLVAVVTPVGEIANYCRDMENGVIYDGAQSTLAKIDTLLREPEAYSRVSKAAAEAWGDKPLYADDFIDAAAELRARSSTNSDSARV